MSARPTKAGRKGQHPGQIPANHLPLASGQPKNLLLGQLGVPAALLLHIPGVNVRLQGCVAAVVTHAGALWVILGTGINKGMAGAVAHIMAVGSCQVGKADLPLDSLGGQADKSGGKKGPNPVVMQIGPQVPVPRQGQAQKIVAKQIRPLAAQIKGPAKLPNRTFYLAIRQAAEHPCPKHAMGSKSRHGSILPFMELSGDDWFKVLGQLPQCTPKAPGAYCAEPTL